jgi:CRP/FNR family transcriptional activator FtrB
MYPSQKSAGRKRSHGAMTKPKPEIDGHVLHSIPLFAGLSEDHFTRFVAAASVREIPPRTMLFAEGDQVTDLYALLRGVVELFSEREDRRFTAAVVHAAHPLAVSTIFADRYPLSARVLEHSELIVAPAKLVIELLRLDPGLASALATEMAFESAQIIRDFKSHRLLTTSERLAGWILRYIGRSGGTGEITIPFDKRVLASYLGMAPEQLSRHFASMESAGVTVQGRCITVTDREALAKIAGSGNPIVRRTFCGST